MHDVLLPQQHSIEKVACVLHTVHCSYVQTAFVTIA